MNRTYLVLALANMALRDPDESAQRLTAIDAIIDDTTAAEQREGPLFFLMDYARNGTFHGPTGRSIFLDGEIALMLAARNLVAAEPHRVEQMAERIGHVRRALEASALLCAESYPNECWMFCNTVALAALRLAAAIDGSDPTPLFEQWVARVRQRLVDPETGLLVSSFTYDGQILDGPEGSTIWMVAHCLQLVDADFADDQYARAHGTLADSILGFGYSREWPSTWRGPVDVDSGPVIPVLDISPSASGLALVAAAAFTDPPFLHRLFTSLWYGGFPDHTDNRLRFQASNGVGDSVILYAMTLGPLWHVARERTPPARGNADSEPGRPFRGSLGRALPGWPRTTVAEVRPCP